MIEIDMTLPTDVLNALRDEMQKAPKLVQGGFRRLANQSRQRTLGRVTKAPPKWTGKRRWNSERQRKAYFATNGFGGGIPSQRTGRLQAGWEMNIDIDDEGGVIELFNDAPEARYVQGDDAQLMHLDSDWPQAAPIATEEFDILEDNMIDLFFLIADPNEGF